MTVDSGIIKLPIDGASIELGSSQSKIIDKKLVKGGSGPVSTHIVGLDNFIGIEVPRMTTVERNDIGTYGLGATGPNIITFDKTTNKFMGWNGTTWVELG